MPPKRPTLEHILELLHSYDRDNLSPDQKILFNGSVRVLRMISRWNQSGIDPEDDAAWQAKQQAEAEDHRKAKEKADLDARRRAEEKAKKEKAWHETQARQREEAERQRRAQEEASRQKSSRKPSAAERAKEAGEAAARAHADGDFKAAHKHRMREAYYRNHEARKQYQRNYNTQRNDDYEDEAEETEDTSSSQAHGSETRGGRFDDKTDFYAKFRSARDKHELRRIFMDLVRLYHPDHGGDHQTMARLNAAHDQVKQRFQRN